MAMRNAPTKIPERAAGSTCTTEGRLHGSARPERPLIDRQAGRERLLRRGAASPVIVILLTGILLALVGLIVVLIRNYSGGNSPTSPATKRSDLGPNETLTREDAEKSGRKFERPSKKIDDEPRIVQTYKVGNKYRSLLKVGVDAKATSKDWGIQTDTFLHYVGECEILRTIEHNDGTTLVLLQEFTRARTLAAWSTINDLSVDLGTAGHVLMEIGGAGATGEINPGWSVLLETQVNDVLKYEPLRQLIASAYQDPAAKIKTRMNSLQGKKVRLTYVNGVGVKSIVPVGCSLDEDEQNLMFRSSVISDAYILPDPQSKPGDKWTVDGSDMVQLIDPSLHMSVSGSLTAVRRNNGGTKAAPKAQISLDEGVLAFQDVSGSAVTNARWAPRGKMEYSFKDQIVTEARLGGEFSIMQRSTDHIIFEAKYSMKPDYKVLYSCEVVQ